MNKHPIKSLCALLLCLASAYYFATQKDERATDTTNSEKASPVTLNVKALPPPDQKIEIQLPKREKLPGPDYTIQPSPDAPTANAAAKSQPVNPNIPQTPEMRQQIRAQEIQLYQTMVGQGLPPSELKIPDAALPAKATK